MNRMNDQLERFKKMMKSAKQSQENFRKQLEQFEDDMQSSNFGEFPAKTLFTDNELKKLNESQNERQENDLHKSNRDSIDELSDHLKVHQAGLEAAIPLDQMKSGSAWQTLAKVVSYYAGNTDNVNQPTNSSSNDSQTDAVLSSKLDTLISLMEQFGKQLEQFEDDMQSSNFCEFPENTLFADNELKKLNESQNERQENDLHKSNRDSIDELSDHLKVHQAGSVEGYLANIGHSLMMIANSLRHIEDRLEK